MWGFLFLLPAVAIIISVIFIEQAESSLWLAYLCLVVNGIGSLLLGYGSIFTYVR